MKIQAKECAMSHTPTHRSAWVIERNHEPLLDGGRVVCFPCGDEGTQAARKYLNFLHFIHKDEEVYFDAVLWNRNIEHADLVAALERITTELEYVREIAGDDRSFHASHKNLFASSEGAAAINQAREALRRAKEQANG